MTDHERTKQNMYEKKSVDRDNEDASRKIIVRERFGCTRCALPEADYHFSVLSFRVGASERKGRDDCEECRGGQDGEHDGENFFPGAAAASERERQRERERKRESREKGEINKSIPGALAAWHDTGWPEESGLPRFFNASHIAKSNWSIGKQPSFEWA